MTTGRTQPQVKGRREPSRVEIHCHYLYLDHPWRHHWSKLGSRLDDLLSCRNAQTAGAHRVRKPASQHLLRSHRDIPRRQHRPIRKCFHAHSCWRDDRAHSRQVSARVDHRHIDRPTAGRIPPMAHTALGPHMSPHGCGGPLHWSGGWPGHRSGHPVHVAIDHLIRRPLPQARADHALQPSR